MVRLCSFGFGVGLLLAPLWVSAAQSTITGRLQQKHGDSFSPVQHCTVFASSADRGPLIGEYSDSQGHFRLDIPPDGSITVGTMCPGLRLSAVDGQAIEVSAHPTLPAHDCSSAGLCADLQLVVEPLAVIEGHVVDDNGMPLEAIRVSLRMQAGGSLARIRQATSDDRGYFRFYHLLPGDYELLGVLSGSIYSRRVGAEPLRLSVGAGDVVSTGPVHLPRAAPSMPQAGPSGSARPGGIAEESGHTLDGEIVAKVIDSAGNSVTGAQVILRGISAANQSVTRISGSDAAGRIRFDDLPNGAFRAQVLMAGHSLDPASAHRVELQGDNARGRMELRLFRRPVLAGRVVDEQGEPMPETRIQLFFLATNDGELVVAPGQSTITDDRGTYRTSVARPGRYWVMATHMEASFPLGSAPQSTGTVFYPNSPDLLFAQFADLEFNQPDTRFDITLPPAPRTAITAGLLSGPEGRPCAQCAFSLRRVEGPYEYEWIHGEIGGRLPGFEYRGIPAGDYRILVEDRDNDTPGWWAIEDVTLVEDDPVALAIATQPPVVIPGCVALENPPLGWLAENRELADSVNVQLTPVGEQFFSVQDALTTRVELSPKQLEFKLGPMPPGKFRLEAWVKGTDGYLAGVAQEGRGLASPVLDFSQAGDWTNLDLRVRFDMARPAIRTPAQTSLSDFTMYRVVLVPDRNQNPFGQYVEGFCGPDGACEISPLPPGRYWVIALSHEIARGLDLRDSQDGNRLAAWGRNIDFSPGQNAAVELRPVPEEALEGIY